MRRIVALCLLACVGAAGGARAQAPAAPVNAATPSAKLDFRRVFASPALNGPAPRGVQVSPDGRWLTLLKNRPEDRTRYDLWGYDRTTRRWAMLLDSQALSPAAALSEAEKMQRERQRISELTGIVDYSWSEDSKHLLVPLDGKLFLAGLDGHAAPIEPAGQGALNPTLSPDGRLVSFVRDRRVWVVATAGGAAHAITPDEAADTVHWGEAEFVAQEEMDRQQGAWWAPDSGRIAIERFDEAKVGVVTRAAIGASGTSTYAQRYPAAGTPNVAVELWVMKPDGTARVKVDLGADPDIYLARVDWAQDEKGVGKTLYVQRENRAQSQLDMLAVDPATGASHIVFSEHAAPGAWINLSDNYRFLKDGSLIWWSERDGFGHLYRFWPNHHPDSQWQQLTAGAWVVTNLVGVDEKAGRVFFAATKDDVLATQVYALDLDAAEPRAHITRLTDPAYANSATMDKAGTALAISRSSPSQPPQSYLADTAGQRLVWIEQNALEAAHPYAPFLATRRLPSFGQVSASDGTRLYWRMITPPLARGQRYPVFFMHYGGPHAQEVTRGWTSPLEQAIVAKGYILFELDNRGSANRGVAFESQLNRAMGGVEVADQLAGLAYLKALPFVDPGKIATFGWSYGGYLTLKLLEAAPGAFAAGIAVAPVTRWELYDTHYTERYLGMPQDPGGVYAHSDALPEANKITDPLLIIHGMADDNVVFENTTALLAKLQAADRPFETMLYPGQTHALSGEGVRVHVWNTMFDFLARRGITPSG